MFRHLVLAVLVGGFSFPACSDDGGHGEGEGKATGSTCPPGSTVTYADHIAAFMEDYCVSCHSSQLAGEARNEAPLGHDFDSEAGILVVAEHVDEYAAAGPDAVNTVMPPSGAAPTEQERRMLGEWLACEAGGGGDH